MLYSCVFLGSKLILINDIFLEVIIIIIHSLSSVTGKCHLSEMTQLPLVPCFWTCGLVGLNKAGIWALIASGKTVDLAPETEEDH